MDVKIPIWVIIIVCVMCFILGTCGGYITREILPNNRNRNDIDIKEIEEGRRIINAQRNIIEQFGKEAREHTIIIGEQRQRIASLIDRQSEIEHKIREARTDTTRITELSEEAGNEIQQVINILETIRSRK